MKPLHLTSIDPASRQRTVKALQQRWLDGDENIRRAFAAADFASACAAIHDHFAEMDRREQVYVNNRYQVHVRYFAEEAAHLSIRRLDRQPVHDWRDLQEIKNQLLGPECEAVELYPAESRRVDTANQYHLWGYRNPSRRFPLGFDSGRIVSDDSLAGSVNRPLSESDKNNLRTDGPPSPTEAGI